MKKFIVISIQFALVVAFAWLMRRHFDAEALYSGWTALSGQPFLLAAMTAAYAVAFWLKAVAWRLYLPPDNRPRSALLYHGLIYSLLINHVLPVKVGDAARVGILWARGKVPGTLALQSVVVMRALDVAALALLAAAGAPIWLGAGESTPVYVSAAALFAALLAAVLALRLADKLPWASARRQATYAREALRGVRGVSLAALTIASWVLEAAVVFAVAAVVTAGGAVTVLEAVWANALTIAGGPAYIGPGGIGGYESAMSYALSRAGLPWSEALAVALLSHSFKFAFSYAAGLITWVLLPIRWTEWSDWLARRKEAVRWTE
jgi:uncharacterized membrane protein YbhN (UPF0104 family)